MDIRWCLGARTLSCLMSIPSVDIRTYVSISEQNQYDNLCKVHKGNVPVSGDIVSEDEHVEVENLRLSLAAVKDEYAGEQARIGTFENRTGFLLSLSGALIVFAGQFFVKPKQGDFFALVDVLQYLSMLILLASILCLILVITTRTFYRVQHDRFSRQDFLEAVEQEALSMMILEYRGAIEKTLKGINARSKWFTIGLWLLFSGLMLLTITRILILYTGG